MKGHSHLYDSLDDAMVNKEIEASKEGNCNSSTQEVGLQQENASANMKAVLQYFD